MKIVIGTKNPAKLSAIKLGIEKCVYFKNGKNIEIISQNVDSGVSDMPKDLDENISGAKNRVLNCKNIYPNADFYVGMEGGTTIIGEKAYLFGVIFIKNNFGEGHLGFSPMIEVPKSIKDRIYKSGEDLGKIQDELSREKNNAHRNGSFGEWTGDMITRSQTFEIAFLTAISPFYNKYY